MTENPRKSEVRTVSGKELNELIQTGELAKVDPAAEPIKESEVSEELLEAAEAHAEKQIADLKEENQKRKRSLIKLGIMTLLSVIIFVFTTIAWFSMNVEVGTSGMQMSVGYNGFELKVASGTVAYSELYPFLNEEMRGNTDLETNTSEGGETIRWRISGSSDTLRPGSQGVLEFWIISTGADVSSLNYNLDIQCYTAVEGSGSTVIGLSEITETSGHTANEKNGANYLKSHLMFFEGRTGETEATYQYSGFIDNIDSFRLTPTLVEGKTNEYYAKIYWVWPNTIGQILLNSSRDHVM